jgi:alpha-tubulin suppressor-like RCC1 family protein
MGLVSHGAWPGPGLSRVRAISAGDLFCLALLRTGTVIAWGQNYQGELGRGSSGGGEAGGPGPVNELSGVIAISAGYDHSLALLSSRTIMAWGTGQNGELGNPVEAESNVPVPVTGLRHVRAVAGGSSFSLAIARVGRPGGQGQRR